MTTQQPDQNPSGVQNPVLAVTSLLPPIFAMARRVNSCLRLLIAVAFRLNGTQFYDYFNLGVIAVY
jgi:hypothetical protein